MSGRHQARSRAGAGLAGRAASGWRRLTGAASGTALAFGVLALACAFVAVAGPRTSAQLRTSAFRQLAASAPALNKTIVGTLDAGSLGSATGAPVGASQLTQVEAGLREHLVSRAPLAARRFDWVSMTTPFAGFADHSPTVATGVGTQFELVYRSDLSQNVRVLAGSLPSALSKSGGTMVVPTAITQATARRYGLFVGARVSLGSAGIMLRVTGIVTPATRSGTFWQFDPVVSNPVLVTPSSGPPYWQGGAFVPAAALPALTTAFSPDDVQLTWIYGLSLGQLSADQAVSLAQALPGTLATAGQLNLASGSGTPADVTLTSAAALLLASFDSADGAVGNVLDLLSVSLAVVGAAIVLLAAWLMAEKRRDEFAVLRARGAARRQLAGAALAGSAVVALPAAGAGIAAAIGLTAGSGSPLAWWLGGLIVAVALAGPVLITLRMHRGYAGATRPDRPVRRMTSIRRIVAEAALVLGAVGGLIVLRHQGAGQTEGDLYASTAPILVAIPVAIILLRLYPLLVRPLLLLAGRRPGVTVFLGLARAARVSATSVLPAFAMVLALSLVSFAGMVRGAVIRGEVAQSWQQVGADAVITVPNALSAAQQRTAAATPGVQRAVAFGLTSAATKGAGLTGIAAVVTDPAQYVALLGASPLAPVPASFAAWPRAAASDTGAAVPVLASAPLGTRLGRAPVVLKLLDGKPIRVYVAGVAPAMSAITAVSGAQSPGYVVLPRSALHGDVPPVSGLLLAGPGLDGHALLRTVSGWRVPGAAATLRSAELTALEGAPLQRGAYAELADGGYAAAAGCLLVLLLTLMLSARSRQLTLARAATMGMSPAQARWLALVEALPQLLSVLIGGLVCALVLVPLVGPALELSVFTGSTAAVPVRVEPAWLTATAIGLLVLAIATLTGQTMLASRGTARSLRIGE